MNLERKKEKWEDMAMVRKRGQPWERGRVWVSELVRVIQ